MKKYSILILLMCFSFMLNAQTKVDGNETITKQIKLQFNEPAIRSNEYVIFSINDDFDFNNFNLLVNGVPHHSKTIKVVANNKIENVRIEISRKKTSQYGTYNFSLKLAGASNALQATDAITYKGVKSLKHINIIIPKTPKERYITYGIYFLVLLFVIFFIRFVVNKTKEFKKGHLDFKNGEYIELKRYKRKYTHKNENKEVVFYLIKGKKGQPKIYTKLDIEANNEVIANGYQIQLEDRIKIKDNDNNIEFTYY